MPQQLVAGASKFFLSQVSTDARAREYRSAVFWLEEAGLITRIYRARKPALPLSADCNFDAYKVSLFDTGLLRAAAGISPDALQSQTPEAAAVRATLNRNALTQSLTAQLKARPAYFETNGRMSADFLIQTGTDLIPAELALNPSRRKSTVKRFAVRQKMPFAVRFSHDNLSFTDSVMTIPRRWRTGRPNSSASLKTVLIKTAPTEPQPRSTARTKCRLALSPHRGEEQCRLLYGYRKWL